MAKKQKPKKKEHPKPIPPREDREEVGDQNEYVGLPARDLKKNLGCG